MTDSYYQVYIDSLNKAISFSQGQDREMLSFLLEKTKISQKRLAEKRMSLDGNYTNVEAGRVKHRIALLCKNRIAKMLLKSYNIDKKDESRFKEYCLELCKDIQLPKNIFDECILVNRKMKGEEYWYGSKGKIKRETSEYLNNIITKLILDKYEKQLIDKLEFLINKYK